MKSELLDIKNEELDMTESKRIVYNLWISLGTKST